MESKEIWKDIVVEKDGRLLDFSGLYMISNTGRVYSVKKGGVLKACPKSSGYLQVGLYKDREHFVFAVHRLVAVMFLPNPNSLPVVNHKDENKVNNHVDNLEWCTQYYNVHYGTGIERMRESRKGARLTDSHKKNIAEANKKRIKCIETGDIFDSIMEATVWCGLRSNGKIGECCKGKRRTAGKHPETGESLSWMYVD